MTPKDLENWQGYMTAAEAAAALGLSRSHYLKLRNGSQPIRRMVALACAAVAADLRPYGEGEQG